MRLYIHVECLRFQLTVRWVIHARNRLCRAQMVQVLGQLGELGPSALLLPDLLVPQTLLMVTIEQTSDLLVLVLDMLEVLLASIEVVLVLPAVVPSVTKQITCRGLTIFVLCALAL